MQWWMRPGPSRPWAIANPSPGPEITLPSDGALSTSTTAPNTAAAVTRASRRRGAQCTWAHTARMVHDASAAKALLPMPVNRAAVCRE